MNVEMPPMGIARLGLGHQPDEDGPPLVSVIVTNHNYGRFLRSCLENICTQSYTNIECIVIDDASTDDSCAVLDEIVDSGAFNIPGRSLQVIKSAVNLKMIGAACKAFEHATGSYIIFFDADDIMLPQLVEAHVTAFFYCRIGIGISSTDMFFARSGEIIRGGHPGFVHFINAHAGSHQPAFRKTALPFSYRKEAGPAALDLSLSELYHLPPSFIGWGWSSTSALCFRRELVEKMLKRVPNMTGCLDAYLLRGIHPFTGAILIDRPLVAYRIHQNNDWIKFPPIENFRNWDIGRELGVTRQIADEILQAHLLNADFYGQYLYNHDNFIQAIEWLYSGSQAWSSNGPPREPFSTEAFLIAHEGRLREAFGDATFQRWMGPYRPAGRAARFLWRSALLRPARTLLRLSLGDAGISRLRARLYR